MHLQPALRLVQADSLPLSCPASCRQNMEPTQLEPWPSLCRRGLAWPPGAPVIHYENKPQHGTHKADRDPSHSPGQAAQNLRAARDKGSQAAERWGGFPDRGMGTEPEVRKCLVWRQAEREKRGNGEYKRGRNRGFCTSFRTVTCTLQRPAT